MSVLLLLPLFIALALCSVVALDAVDPAVERAVTRTALTVFGEYVSRPGPRRSRQTERLRAAHVSSTHRRYAARTLFLSAIYGVAGSVIGVYVAAVALRLLAVDGDSIGASLPPQLSILAGLGQVGTGGPLERFALLATVSAVVAAVLGYGAYWVRWTLLDQRANARANGIDVTLPRTVAFVYALSRSGMAFPRVLDTLAANRDVYGEAANELSVTVRDVDAFGTDLLTALRRTARWTPSEPLEEFTENLVSVLGSGQSVSAYLRTQYDRFLKEAEAQQKRYLDMLSAFAEIYVTALVAGPLFLITTLIVIGLVIKDTIGLVAVLVYAGIPLATAGFVVYVDGMMNALSLPGGDVAEIPPDGARTGPSAPTGASSAAASTGTSVSKPPGSAARADGGHLVSDRHRENRERLATYDRFRSLRRAFDDPIRRVLRNPAHTFLVTVPLGILWVLVSALRGPRPTTVVGTVRTLDDPLVQASIVVLGLFALVYELRKRRLRAIEATVPDFLDRLAGVNDAGLTVVESVFRVADTDLGALTDDVRRMRRDVQWGSDVVTALRRMARRTGSPTVSRAVVLITNASVVSGDVAPVLHIAADEAQATRRLRAERRQEMLTYLLVIYLSFLVFLAIVVALTVSFLPAVQTAHTTAPDAASSGVQTGPFTTLGTTDTSLYALVFFHATALQAVCSGLVAGQLGEGRLADGAKHATAMLVLAFAASLLL